WVTRQSSCGGQKAVVGARQSGHECDYDRGPKDELGNVPPKPVCLDRRAADCADAAHLRPGDSLSLARGDLSVLLLDLHADAAGPLGGTGKLSHHAVLPGVLGGSRY